MATSEADKDFVVKLDALIKQHLDLTGFERISDLLFAASLTIFDQGDLGLTRLVHDHTLRIDYLAQRIRKEFDANTQE